MKSYVYLILAILSEVIATTALKASAGFSKVVPSLMVIIGYGTAFYLLSLTLKSLPLGIAYATWSGLGTVGVVIAGILLYRETVQFQHVIGIVLIIIGSILLNLTRNPAA